MNLYEERATKDAKVEWQVVLVGVFFGGRLIYGVNDTKHEQKPFIK